MNVVEYVGPEGVRSTPAERYRLAKPRPGDLIRWLDGTIGMIETVGTGHVQADEVHAVEKLGSAFLGLINDRPYVNISGGPFCCMKLADLAPALGDFQVVRFWNWGDNTSGAGKGVEYHLARPVFRATAPRMAITNDGRRPYACDVQATEPHVDEQA